MLIKPPPISRICLLFAVVLGLSACKKRPPPPEPGPAESASALPPAPPAPRCAELKPGQSFTLGDRPAPAAADAGEELDDDQSDEQGLPFAVEIGSAVAFGDGFAVSALNSKGGVTRAEVVLLDADANKGRIADLGRLHADPDPPDLAAADGDLVALVHDTDAGGELLRLVALKPNGDKVDVVLGAEVKPSKDESRVAHLELGSERGVSVWDEYDKAEKHGVIRAVSFAKKDVSNATRPRTISASGDDAEAPRVARRPGGFWAAWVSRGVSGKSKPPPLAAKKPDAGAEADDKEPGPAVVELGERWLTLTPLDENGVPSAEPRAVTTKKSHVLAFDLASLPDGGALIAWRDDDTVPGAEERRVLLAHVRPDGSVEASSIDDEKVGAGAPSLLVDAKPKDAASGAIWLSLDSVSDSTRFGALSQTGALLDALDSDPAIRSGDPLVLSAGRLLIAHARGLAVELSVVGCKPGAPPAADAGSAAPLGSAQ